jgi:hypothetical protein
MAPSTQRSSPLTLFVPLMFHDRSSHINMRFSAAAGVLLKPRFRNSSLFAIFSCQVAALSRSIGKFSFEGITDSGD